MAKFNRNNEWNISRSVIIVNLFYLFYYGGKACLFPFITLYFRSLGLSATQTGIICGSKYLIWSIAAPLWIFMANRMQKTKIVLGISLLLSIASCLAITLVQPANVTQYLAPCLIEEGKPAFILPDSTITMQNQTHSTQTQPSQITLSTIITTTSKTISPSMAKTTPTTPMTEAKISSTVLTTTETSPYEDDEKLSNYQLAVAIFPDILENGITDENEVEDYLGSNERTSFYPSWKLKVLKIKIMGLLEKTKISKEDKSDGDEDADQLEDKVSPHPFTEAGEDKTTVDVSDPDEVKESTKNPETSPAQKDTEDSKDDKEETRKSSEKEKKAGDSQQIDEDDFDTDRSNKNDQNRDETAAPSSTLNNLLDRLIPLYLERREQYPGLSIATFLAHEHGTKDQNESVRNYLEREMIKELESDDIQKRSIDDNANDTIATEDHVTVKQTTEKENYYNATLRKSVENLVNQVLPSITDNIGVFILLLAIVVAGESLSAPTEMLSDSAFYEFLDELDSLDKYGRHRVSGLVGTLLCGITISFIVYFSPCVLSGNIVSFHIHFYGFAALIGMAFLIAPFYPTYKSNNSKSSSGVGLCPSCTSLFCSDCRHSLLLLTVFFAGIAQAAVQDFILWEVQDLEGSTEVIYGSYVSASAFCAILSMMVSRRILKALKPCVSGPLSLFCIALQLLLYSYMYFPWMIVPLQLLNILGQSFLWAVISHQTNLTMTTSWSNHSSTRRVNEVYVFARASQQRALQTAYLMTYQGISFAFGSVLAGFAYDLSGGTLAPFLRISAGVLSGWAVVYMLYQCCCFPNRRQRKYSKLLEDSADEEDFIYDANDSFLKVESNGGYIKNNGGKRSKRAKRGRGLREKRRNKGAFLSSSSNDDDYADESDWLKMALKKDSRAL